TLDAPAGFAAHLARPEVEARSNRLVEDAGQQHVGPRVEHLRLAIRSQHAVLVDAVAAGSRRLRAAHNGIADDDVARLEAGAREQIDRAVLAPEIAARDLERAARGVLDALLGLAAWPRRPQPRAAFEPAAVRDRRRRRFLHLDQHVAPRAGFVRQLGD